MKPEFGHTEPGRHGHTFGRCASTNIEEVHFFYRQELLWWHENLDVRLLYLLMPGIQIIDLEGKVIH